MPSHLTRASSHPAVFPAHGVGHAASAQVAVGFAAVIVLLSSCKASDDRPATWEYLAPVIFEPMCATGSCHGPASAVSGLDFSTPERGYTSLTGLWVWIVDPKGTPEDGCMTMRGTVACQREQRPLVVPFNPAQSRLINVLRAQNAPRMPPNRPLAESDVALVERWILSGALPAAGATRDAGSGDAAGDAASDRPGDSSVDGLGGALGGGGGGGGGGGAGADAGPDSVTADAGSADRTEGN
jgi:hypothetical protein